MPIDKPQDPNPLQALMRRPDFGGPLRFINLPASRWQASLSRSAEDFDQAVEKLAPLLQRLPRGVLQGSQKMLYRKSVYPELGTILRAYGRALAKVPEIQIGTDAPKLQD